MRNRMRAAVVRRFFAVILVLYLLPGVSGRDLRAQEALPEGTLPPLPQSDLPQTPPLGEPIPAEPSGSPESEPVQPVFHDLPLASTGMGAEAWYYEAKKLEQSGIQDPVSAQSADFMYRLAFYFGEKAAAKEAGKSLMLLSSKAGAFDAAKAFALEWLDFFGPDWEIYKTLITASITLGDSGSVLKAVAAVRTSLPSTAKTRANELAYYEYSSKAALGDFSWSKGALAYLKAYSIDSWGAKILRLAAALPELAGEDREIGLMRADYLEKQYSLAVLHAKAAAQTLHASGSARFLISEAGKSFINAGSAGEGIDFFLAFFPEIQGQGTPTADLPPAEAPAADLSTAEAQTTGDLPDMVFASLSARGSEERLWVAAYYLARLWLSAGREREAAILFLALTDNAPSGGDADGALWYWLDITMRRIAAGDTDDSGGKRPLEFAALVEASIHWKNPAYFDDIIESFDRNLMKEKSWNDVVSLLTLVGARVSPGIRTRLVYQAGRLVEEKLASPGAAESPADAPRGYFEKILADPEAEEYYRTMSAWRLGMAPPYLAAMPDLSRNLQVLAATSAATSAAALVPGVSNGNGVQAGLSLIKNYLLYDLDELASSLAMNYLGSLDKSVIAGLAFELSAEGQHYAALRLARDAIARGSGSQYPDLYGLMYPKAWQTIVADAAAIPSIPEALAYGIIRSESVFDPKAVSYAGAVGLTQLMPSTAAETARGLKMPDYSLTDPDDNLKIGLTYYSYMLARFGGRPMRAMFAYNAGPSRMMIWARESGELPDDLLLETLHLAQPRQYAKNIIQATLAYGKIHYGIEARVLLDYLVFAKPIESAPKNADLQTATAAADAVPDAEVPSSGQGSTM